MVSDQPLTCVATSPFFRTRQFKRWDSSGSVAVRSSVDASVRKGITTGKGSDFVVTTSLLRSVSFPFTGGFFSDANVRLNGNRTRDPFGAPIHVSGLPTRTLNRLTTGVAFTTPRRTSRGSVPLRRCQHASSVDVLYVYAPLFCRGFFSLARGFLYFFFVRLWVR